MSLTRFTALLAVLAVLPWRVVAQSATWTGAINSNCRMQT